MGKTAQGAVWLNSDQLSPYEYWQYWRNTEDDDVGRFMRLFTELPLDEIARLEALAGAEINEAKKVLATEATALLHGRAAADDAAETARRTFEEGGATATLPTTEISYGDGDKRSAAAILKASGLVRSMGEARRKIAEGAVRINDRVIRTNTEGDFTRQDADQALGAFKVQLGKRKIVLVKPVD
jgi:tyrosyl-tRNA synthetase